jgi:hypothetical protein
VGAPEVADKLPGRRVHPPALQEVEEDDHGYGDEDRQDGDGRQQLRQGEPPLVFSGIELGPDRVHDWLIVTNIAVV